MRKSHIVYLLLAGMVLFSSATGSEEDHRHGHETVHEGSHSEHESHVDHEEEERGHHDAHSSREAAEAEGNSPEGHTGHEGHVEHEEHGAHDHGAAEADHDEHGHSEDDAETVEITPEQLREIGLSFARASSGRIAEERSFMGEVLFNEDSVAHLVPKVEGIVRSVKVSLGARVVEGQELAVIDSPELAETKADYLEKKRIMAVAKRAYERKEYLRKENIASEADRLEKEAEFLNAETAVKSAHRKLHVVGLSDEEIEDLSESPDAPFGTYVLRSPIPGTVVAKHITRGEKVAGDSEVFTVADLSSVWVDLRVPVRDLALIREGMKVTVEAHEGEESQGTIALLGPVVDESTRSALARVVLPNPKQAWRPGRFVVGRVRLSMTELPIVVAAEAVQNIEGVDVVFVPENDAFRPVPVTVGMRTKDSVEIVRGLAPGDTYVLKGAFELKAVKVTSGVSGHAGHGH